MTSWGDLHHHIPAYSCIKKPPEKEASNLAALPKLQRMHENCSFLLL
jgi:hypothetical protein